MFVRDGVQGGLARQQLLALGGNEWGARLGERTQWGLEDAMISLLKRFMKIVVKNVNIFLNKCSKGRFEFRIGCAENKVTRKTMKISITNEQKIQVSLEPKTATEKPAQVDGVPKWTKQSGDSTIEVAEDGKSAILISSDTLGLSSFLVEADADLGDGFEPISELIELEVLGAKAVNLGLIPGTPEPK